MSTSKSGIAGVVLAGGQSRRMGGGDKSLLDLGGKPMLAHVVDRLGAQADPLAISANGDPERFRSFGLPVIADSVPGFAGPLAGVLAGLRWAAAEVSGATHVVTVAADAPFIPDDLVLRLSEASLTSASGLAVAASDGRVHPVIGLWPLGIADAIAAALARDERKVTAFVEGAGAQVVDFGEVTIGEGHVDPFFNANTPQELAMARNIVATESRVRHE